ncbi:MAG: hypothetical protein ACRDUY_15595 [Nitriliruptorales bacterium]
MVATIVTLIALVLVAFGGNWVLDWRAARAAEVAAANAEVRSDIAARLSSIAAAATEGAEAAASLRLTLQEHLTVSDRTDEQLATDRDLQTAALADASKQLARNAEAPAPTVPESADESAINGDLDVLESAQEQAGELADSFAGLVDSSEQWADTLVTLRARAERYVETVDNQPNTHDPGRLLELWGEELDVLKEYREAAAQAGKVPGLEAVAEAYLTYVDANIEFAEEAIGLLKEEKIDTYNERLRETYGTADPFDFQSGVAEATQQSLEAGVLADLAEATRGAEQLSQRMRTRERTLLPTPSPSA